MCVETAPARGSNIIRFERTGVSGSGDRAPAAELGLLDATTIGMGAMIGAGIFVRTGLAAEEFGEYVDTVVFPERAGARSAANAIEPLISSFEDVSGTLELFQIRVSEGAPVAGQTLSVISLPRGGLIVSDDDATDVTGPETTLDPGSVYVVAAEPAVVDEVMNTMRG